MHSPASTAQAQMTVLTAQPLLHCCRDIIGAHQRRRSCRQGGTRGPPLPSAIATRFSSRPDSSTRVMSAVIRILSGWRGHGVVQRVGDATCRAAHCTHTTPRRLCSHTSPASRCPSTRRQLRSTLAGRRRLHRPHTNSGVRARGSAGAHGSVGELSTRFRTSTTGARRASRSARHAARKTSTQPTACRDSSREQQSAQDTAECGGPPTADSRAPPDSGRTTAAAAGLFAREPWSPHGRTPSTHSARYCWA